MRIPLVVLLTPLALQLACSDEGPIQGVGPKLIISPDTVSVETGADPITLQAVPQNGTLTGSVSWTMTILTGSGGTLGQSSGSTVTFTPSGLGTSGGKVVIQATATVGGVSKPATAEVTVEASTHGRIAMGIDPGGAVAWVDISDGTSKATFVTSVLTVLRSGIIDAGTYSVTADAGIAVPGTVVDGIYDGTVQFDGGTPARSVNVPVKPNQESTVEVRFGLRGGLGRLWLPAGGNIRGYTETELLVDHDGQTGFLAAGARAIAFDADGNLWATFSDGVRMYTPDSLADPNAVASRTVTLNDATGIAIRGDTIAVASCAGSAVSTFSRTAASPNPMALISITCPWGISYDTGNTGKLWVASKSGANGNKVYRYLANSGTVDGTGIAVTDAYGIAIDSQGNVWASSCSGNFVQKVSPTVGSQVALLEFACPGGLAFDKADTLWVLSSASGSSGNLLSFPTAGSSGTIQLNSLSQVTFGGLAFDPGAAGLPVHQ
jgi:hypothetical protein